MLDPSTVLDAGKLPADLLTRLLSGVKTDDPRVLVAPAPGFDATMIRPGDDIIVKSDPITFATASPGDYLVAVNANDIACLGGVPRWLMVTALFPHGSTTAGDVEDLFVSLTRACERLGVALVGGHTEITPGIDRLLLSGTMIGLPGENGALLPGGARAGDELWMTQAAGIEGSSIIASEAPESELGGIPDQLLDVARGLLDDPGISIVAAAELARKATTVTAMHDPTEGGIATAIHELADASGLGFEVDLERIPVWPVTRALADRFDISPLGLISSGALLFATAPGAEDDLQRAFGDAGIPVTRIGQLVADLDHRVARTTGGQQPLPRYDADEITRVFARIDSVENRAL
jgi:hydrogenase expression/formation protein HypE